MRVQLRKGQARILGVSARIPCISIEDQHTLTQAAKEQMRKWQDRRVSANIRFNKKEFELQVKGKAAPLHA